MNGWPEWAIISVASVDTLAKHAAGGGTRTVVKGTGDHNAIVELTPESSEDDAAFDLARVLAQQTKRDTCVLFLNIHTSLDDRASYVVPARGKPRLVAEDPGSLAVRLGCELPAPPATGVDETGRHVLVAIGARLDQLERVLLLFALNFMSKFDALVILRWQRGTITGTFSSQPRDVAADDDYKPPFPVLAEIEGETEPLRILAKLDVDPKLLGLAT